MQSTHNSCQILMKPENSLQIFKKYSNFKVHKNPSSGSQAVPYVQKDSHSQNSSMLILRENSGLKSLTLTDIYY